MAFLLCKPSIKLAVFAIARVPPGLFWGKLKLCANKEIPTVFTPNGTVPAHIMDTSPPKGTESGQYLLLNDSKMAIVVDIFRFANWPCGNSTFCLFFGAGVYTCT